MMKDDKDLKKENELKKDERPEETVGEATRVAIDENTLKIKISSARFTPASLVLLIGPKDLVGFSWPLTEPIVTVGRSQRLSDVFVNHENLSKSHFQIIHREGVFYIIDLDSTNKTYKNDQMLEPRKEYEVLNNDLIRASDLIFKFLKKGSVELLSSKSLLDKAYTDSLTGIGSRQYLTVKGRELFSNSEELSLIVFDVDNFKSINDNYGHLAGDYILKTIISLVKEASRGEDVVFRYGGDEFCIFTPNSIEIGKNVSKRIIKNIEKHPFVFEDQEIEVSISIGVATRKETDKKWENIYERADESCYKDKRSKK